MAVPARHPLMTAEQLFELPDDGYRSELVAGEIPTFYWPSAPHLAVEVLSPWDRPAEVRRKVAEYFAAGTRPVWIVDPAAHTVHVHRSPHDVQVLGYDDELSGDDVLPGFRCAVKRLFLK